MRLRDAVQELSWNELWHLVAPLLVTQYSHLAASAMGWQRPPEPVEAMAFLLMDYHQLVNRGKNGVRPTPMERPWEQARRSPRAMSAEDTRLRADLMAGLGLDD